MSTKIGTVVIYSLSKLVLNFEGLYIKISRFMLVLLPEPLGKTDWRPGGPKGRQRGDTWRKVEITFEQFRKR